MTSVPEGSLRAEPAGDGLHAESAKVVGSACVLLTCLVRKGDKTGEGRLRKLYAFRSISE